jgi:hypothetical protein
MSLLRDAFQRQAVRARRVDNEDDIERENVEEQFRQNLRYEAEEAAAAAAHGEENNDTQVLEQLGQRELAAAASDIAVVPAAASNSAAGSGSQPEPHDRHRTFRELPACVMLPENRTPDVFKSKAFMVHKDKSLRKNEVFCVGCWRAGAKEEKCWRDGGNGTTNLKNHLKKKDKKHQAACEEFVTFLDGKTAVAIDALEASAAAGASAAVVAASGGSKMEVGTNSLGTSNSKRGSSALTMEACGLKARNSLTAEAVVELVIRDCLPISICESKAFQNVINTAIGEMDAATWVHVDRRRVTEMIKEKFLIVERRLRDIIQDDALAVSITTDAWTGRNNLQALAITGHFTDPNFELRTATLAMIELLGSHTGAAIAAALAEGLQNLGVRNVSSCTADNAANQVHVLAFICIFMYADRGYQI